MTTTEISKKICHECGQVKLTDAFSRREGSRDGHDSWCMACVESGVTLAATTTRRCLTCSDYYPLDAFRVRKDLHGGRDVVCNLCIQRHPKFRRCTRCQQYKSSADFSGKASKRCRECEPYETKQISGSQQPCPLCREREPFKATAAIAGGYIALFCGDCHEPLHLNHDDHHNH